RNMAERQLPSAISLVDLGEHRLKDLTSPERIYQVAADGLQRNFDPLTSLLRQANNLPIQLTSFVGREEEIEQLKARVLAAPLVTLTGPGGCGKTRLAMQVAAELVDEFKDGVWFVDLVSVQDPEAAPLAVASV